MEGWVEINTFGNHTNRIHIGNLTKLAKGLRSLPKNYNNFDMGSYVDFDGFMDEMTEAEFYETIDWELCGTTACALGHGPQFVEKLEGDEDWDDYCDRLFCSTDSTTYDWLFYGRWDTYDNTHHGAAKRIEYLLKHRCFPPEWEGLNSMQFFSEGWGEG